MRNYADFADLTDLNFFRFLGVLKYWERRIPERTEHKIASIGKVYHRKLPIHEEDVLWKGALTTFKRPPAKGYMGKSMGHSGIAVASAVLQLTLAAVALGEEASAPRTLPPIAVQKSDRVLPPIRPQAQPTASIPPAVPTTSVPIAHPMRRPPAEAAASEKPPVPAAAPIAPHIDSVQAAPRPFSDEQLVSLTAGTGPREHVAQPIPTTPVSMSGPASTTDEDLPILQVGCASCAGGPSGGGSFAGPDLYGALGSVSAGMVGDDPLGNCDENMCVAVDTSGCCVTNCYPMREKCYGYCDDGNLFHRFIGLAYEVICCPDPFYELSGPHWVPAANAAFFTENAQPRGMTRMRWDAGQNVGLPDRNAYFFAQANGTGLGPNPLITAANNPGQLPTGISSVNYDDLNMYVETATKNGKFSAFVNTKYRSVDPDVTPRDAGFGDVEVGTKSLLFDRELIQISLQMKTYIPSGVPSEGTGTGHVSLEPSLLFNVKLDEDLYWQSQTAQWIPFGATYGGGILMLNNSINKVVWRLNPDVCIIAVGEFTAWAFQGGNFTDPATLIPQSSSGGRYYNIAPGLRICFRNFLDFGFGTSFALTGTHYADQLYRLEGRFMY